MEKYVAILNPRSEFLVDGLVSTKEVEYCVSELLENGVRKEDIHLYLVDPVEVPMNHFLKED